MSSSNESDRDTPAGGSAAAGPVIDVKPPSILRTRRVPLLAGAAVVLVLVILIAGYSTWRAGIAPVLAVAGVDLGGIERTLGLPSWMTGSRGPGGEAGDRTPSADGAPREPAGAGADAPVPSGSGAAAVAAHAAPSPPGTDAVPEGAAASGANVAAALLEEWEPRLAAIEERLDRLEAAGEALSAGTATAQERAAGEVRELGERLADLEVRMEHLEVAEEQGGNFPVFMSRLLQFAEKLAAVEAREQVLPEQLDAARAETGAVREQVSGLEQRLDAVAAQLDRPDRERIAFALIALGQLRIATAASGPYRRQLETLRPVFAGEPEVEAALAALEPGADAGAPSLERLRADFPGVVRAALRGRDAETAEGMVGQVLARVTSLVTIRQVDGLPQDSLEARLDEAETELAAGELAGAVSALETLEGAAAGAAAGWLAGARDRLAVDTALASLETVVLARLASG